MGRDGIGWEETGCERMRWMKRARLRRDGMGREGMGWDELDEKGKAET